MPRTWIWLLCLLACFAWPAWAEVPVPALGKRVTDQTGTLSAEQAAALETRLAALESARGSQLAILIVKSTHPETIEQYGIRVAEAWKLGRKGVDDGVLLLVAKDDRELRIEVGYGLEGAIPDAVAKRVIAEVIVPRFKEGDFYAGLQAGTEALIGLVEGEPLPAPTPKPLEPMEPGTVDLIGEAVPLAILIVFGLCGLLRETFGRLVGALIGGGVTFLGGWLLLGSAVLALVFAIIIFFITLVGDGLSGLSFEGGGGGGGFSGGGGGFSGGGGGFGGGGASGRW